MEPDHLVEPIHIRPFLDIIAHEWEDCACLPYVEEANGQILIIHNAWDGRD